MVSTCRTDKRFYLRVRMKRSAQPLPSGSRTNAGELLIPRKSIGTDGAKWTLGRRSRRGSCLRAKPRVARPFQAAKG
jgi:hypothetical protein